MYSVGQHKKRRSRKPFLVLLVVPVYVAYAVLRPLPALQPDHALSQLNLETPAGNLNWSAASQAAIAIAGTDILEISGEQVPVPLASTAKIITALMVLEKQPLKLGEQGARYTITADDVARYQSYVSQDGSVLPVQLGEQLTTYQMLQALMLPSANNIADALALSNYGSQTAYAAAANAYLASHGLTSMHVGSDASGLSPDTVGTARDLAKLGQLAMANPVLVQIVGQETATAIPVAGTIKNVNLLLGTSGIIGIKTGNSEQAGGAFVGAAQVTVNGKPQVIITAVAKAPDLFSSLKQSLMLIRSAQANFKPATVTQTTAIYGRYKTPWGASADVVADRTLRMDYWAGGSLKTEKRLHTISTKPTKGMVVGTLATQASALTGTQAVQLKLAGTIEPPSVWWRLEHPLD